MEDNQLFDLDRLEDYHGLGNDNLYDRVEQVVHTDSGYFQAYVYILPPKKEY